MKRVFLVGASLLILSSTTPVFTNDTNKVISATGNLFIDTPNKRGILQWISGEMGYTDKPLNWDITAFSNLSETKDTVTYAQTSYNRQNSVNQLNLGVGYRQRIDTTNVPLIIELNGFFDSKDGTENIFTFTSSDNFQRYGVGGELKTAHKAKTTDPKYTGQFTLADFDITKQTATGTLSMGNFVIPYGGMGDKTISTTNITGKLTPAQGTQKSDWTLKSLTTPVAATALAISADGKSMTIKKAIDTPATIIAVFESTKYEDKSATFTLATGAGTLGAPPMGTTGKWGKAFMVDYKLYTSDTVGDTTAPFTSDGSTDDFAFSIVPSGTIVSGYTSTSTNMFSTSPINPKSGFITGANLLQSGTLLVKIVRKAKDGLPALTGYVNITVNKQDKSDHPQFTISADAITWAGTNQTVKYTATNTPAGISNPTYTLIQAGTTAGNAVTVASDGAIANTTRGGVVKVKVTYAANDKYEQITHDITVPLNKQTATGTLSMGNFVIPYGGMGDKTISTATITGKLTPAQGTQKSDWTLKSLTTPVAATALAISADGKSMTIKKAIDTPATITAVFESTKYEDKSATFTLATGAGTLGAPPMGTTGKWGKAFMVDYKLHTSDTVGDTTAPFTSDGSTDDFAFSIVPSGTIVSGYTSTSANMFSTSPINPKSGFITGANLLQSGTLLVKIVRKAKDGLPALTGYVNITVNKQDKSDHPQFTISADAITWASTNQTVKYTTTNTPAGISNPTYTLIQAGTTAGTITSTGPGDVGIIANNGIITNTRASGVVKVKVTYPANDKYETMTHNVDVTVKRRSGQIIPDNILEIAYKATSVPWGTTISPTIYGAMPQIAGADLYAIRLSLKSRKSNGKIPVGGIFNQGTGVITNTQSSGTIVVTMDYPENVRYEAGKFQNGTTSKDFILTIQRKPQTARAKSEYRTLGSGKLMRNFLNVRDALENVAGNKRGRHIAMTIEDKDTGLTNGAKFDHVSTGGDYQFFSVILGEKLGTKNAAMREIAKGNPVHMYATWWEGNRKNIKLIFHFKNTPDGRYGSKTVATHWRTY